MVAAPRLLISAVLLAGGCQGTDVVARSAYEPDAPAPSIEEFQRSSKILFKRTIIAFGEDRWDFVISDAKRLQMIARKWRDQKPPEAARAAEHQQQTGRLEQSSAALEKAAQTGEAGAVSRALGEVADVLAKLQEVDAAVKPNASKQE